MGCDASATTTIEKEPKSVSMLDSAIEPMIQPEPKIEKNKVIWIDPFIDNEDDAEELKTIFKSLNIDLFTNIMDSINFLKKAKFETIRLIINEVF